VVIPGEGCIRENKPTRQLVLQALPIPWTVGGIASGGGADGEGSICQYLLLGAEWRETARGREEGQTPLRISEF